VEANPMAISRVNAELASYRRDENLAARLEEELDEKILKYHRTDHPISVSIKDVPADVVSTLKTTYEVINWIVAVDEENSTLELR